MSDLRAFVRAALAEDIGHGDVTTDSCVPEEAVGRAQIVAKEDLVVCGQALAAAVFAELAEQRGEVFLYDPVVDDGTAVVRPGKMGGGEVPAPLPVVASLRGRLRTILTGERVALNLLMKLSGIATNVRAYVEAAGPTGPRVVDTRKTTPLLREYEKMAVRAGGGRNHRHALYDGVLIKDNHLLAAGGPAAAIAACRARAHHLLRVECEVTTLAELEEALAAGAEVVLLDNMTPDQVREAAARAHAKHVLVEVSGGVTLATLRAYADAGADLISVGALTHSAPAVDIGLDFS